MRKPWQIWTLYVLTLLVVIPAMAWLSVQSLELEQARETDRVETELARREAELQERVSSALWRMDGFLTNLIAREATRPWYLYQPFYEVAAFEPDLSNYYRSLRQTSSPQQTLNNAPLEESSQVESSQVEGSQEEIANQAATEPQGFEQMGTREAGYRLASPLLFQPSEYVRLHFEIDRNNFVTSPQIPKGDDKTFANDHGLTDEAILSNRTRMREVKEICEFNSILACCPSDLIPESSLQLAEQSRGFQRNSSGDGVHSLAYAPKVLPAAGEPEFSFFKKLQTTLQPEFNRLKKQIAKNKKPVDKGKPQTKSEPSGKQVAQRSRSISRGQVEYSQRQLNANNYAQTEWTSNQIVEPQMLGSVTAPRKVREGIMQPIWIDGRLVLARRVIKDNQQVIQGCWLDWQKIQDTLRDLVVDLLPDVDFRQCIEDEDEVRWGEVLATLPVRLVIDRPALVTELQLTAAAADPQLEKDLKEASFIRRALWIAWIGLAFAAIAGAFLIHGVLRLSERRGAFVSAVSHELRTPLTTFRMYAEMLAEKMVPPEKQQKYVETLKVESERLWHLVENVLQFARLERSNQKNRLENVSVDDLLHRFDDRLHRRAERESMELVLELPELFLNQKLKTDPSAIEQILFNLVDNACKYARDAEDRKIVISGNVLPTGRLQLSVRDHGPGIKGAERQRMFRPFRKSDMEAANTAQGVGLGLALCRRMAKSLGGTLVLDRLPSDQPGAQFTLEIPLRT